MSEDLSSFNGLHINLFLEKRPCLVVGGGKVAYRKIHLLLSAGARVRCVSPEATPEMEALITSDAIEYIPRSFDPTDLEGMFLVYAATGSRGINRQVLDLCREEQILCCCVDGNWAQSDFTTPAITRHNDLMLSVSSGGNNCRQSKLVKNSLARHLEMMDAANLIVVGTDHRHLTVEEREPYHLSGRRLEQAGFMIMQLWGIHEFMILNTCNRVEVIAVVSDETARNGILRHVMGFAPLKEDKYYLKAGKEAFEHICLVTAGMLSQTPGENHITAQIKEALERARERGWAGNLITEWISCGLHVSKAMKNQVSPLLNTHEIEELALLYVEANGTAMAQATVMILGSGGIGKGVVDESLKRAGRIIWCYHVNRPELPEGHDGRIELCTFNDIKNRITEADVIICAADAPGHILHMGHAPFFNQERSVTAIDLGMPRNIDPELDDLSSDLTIVDLDGLKYWHRRELADMNDILSRCRAIVTEHLPLYDKIAGSFNPGGEGPKRMAGGHH